MSLFHGRDICFPLMPLVMQAQKSRRGRCWRVFLEPWNSRKCASTTLLGVFNRIENAQCPPANQIYFFWNSFQQKDREPRCSHWRGQTFWYSEKTLLGLSYPDWSHRMHQGSEYYQYKYNRGGKKDIFLKRVVARSSRICC